MHLGSVYQRSPREPRSNTPVLPRDQDVPGRTRGERFASARLPLEKVSLTKCGKVSAHSRNPREGRGGCAMRSPFIGLNGAAQTPLTEKAPRVPDHRCPHLGHHQPDARWHQRTGSISAAWMLPGNMRFLFLNY